MFIFIIIVALIVAFAYSITIKDRNAKSSSSQLSDASSTKGGYSFREKASFKVISPYNILLAGESIRAIGGGIVLIFIVGVIGFVTLFNSNDPDYIMAIYIIISLIIFVIIMYIIKEIYRAGDLLIKSVDSDND